MNEEEKKSIREGAYQRISSILNEALKFCNESQFEDFKKFPRKEIDQLIDKISGRMLQESKFSDSE